MKKKTLGEEYLPAPKWKGLDPQYLTDNDLWDSSWLMEKYPERFQKDLFS